MADVTTALATLGGSGWTPTNDPRYGASLGYPQLLARSAVKVDLTGTTTETALATVPVPAGAMGLNGGLLICTAWSFTNSANNKTPRIRLGGIAGTAFLQHVQTAVASASDLRRIKNRGAANSQVGSSALVFGASTSSGAIPTSAIDTSAAVDLVISGQLALGTETISLEMYEVWLLP